jgi:hypothetical protein
MEEEGQIHTSHTNVQESEQANDYESSFANASSLVCLFPIVSP